MSAKGFDAYAVRSFSNDAANLATLYALRWQERRLVLFRRRLDWRNPSSTDALPLV
ncbi:hypothetical protein RB10745 [Rhodopirellula baltica SH 1]|uniref:Uncharacterized protein n=1 Tax=Rhodopirellula baltica (strain DSM 10527 / NCIMB 13988 / SH1) TaxID=243090 RepID=Q7UKB2_RHOBA|nr:hypothetical protein RB10745 [Rhodopirellula baltica SH 1]